jgi:hypothetical protein
MNEQPAYDETYGGPVCEPCRKHGLWAMAMLKRHAKASRPINESDITVHNCKRMQEFL